MDTKNDVVSQNALRRLAKKEEFNQFGKSLAIQLKQITTTNNTREFLTSFMAQCEGTLSKDDWSQVSTQLAHICQNIQKAEDKHNRDMNKSLKDFTASRPTQQRHDQFD